VRTHAVARKAFVVKAEGEKDEAVAYCKTLPGISAPFPDMFDPAGLLATATVEDVRRYREAELTHGRVAMLASLGFVVGEQLEDFPAFMNIDGNITGPAINQFQQVQSGFWVPLVIAIGVCEAYRVSVGWARPDSSGVNKLLPEYEMGDLGFDPLGLAPTDPAELKEKKTRELNNGRLAMIAIAGFVTQEFVNNTEIFQHLLKKN
jgi:light-harvesting complex I chlorophyll a/b binding protein 1